MEAHCLALKASVWIQVDGEPIMTTLSLGKWWDELGEISADMGLDESLPEMKLIS